MPTKPRVEVIQLLAEAALEGMEAAGPDDMTAAEVISCLFTATKRTCEELIKVANLADRDHNINSITDAIAGLYSILPPKSIN